MKCFHLPESRVMEMEDNELLDWFEKAADLHAREMHALALVIHGGDYVSPYELPD